MALELTRAGGPHWIPDAAPDRAKTRPVSFSRRVSSRRRSRINGPLSSRPNASRTPGITVATSFTEDNIEDLDHDFVDAVNEVCNKTLKAIVEGDEAAAEQTYRELEEMSHYLLEEQELEGLRFLNVLQGLLQHTVIKDAEMLKGIYKQAFNRLANSIQGSEWKLAREGSSAEIPDGQPKFSTWEEALGKKKKEVKTDNEGPVELEYYELLGVPPSSGPGDLKNAYRKLALQWHPDVSDKPDAESMFKRISQAYDVLSDETARKLYDEYGAEGMKSQEGGTAGRGNADRLWDEFKPFKRENRRTKARSAARESSINHDDLSGRIPEPGDIVEYPLSDLVKEDLQDGREKGLGLLVGRNMDRGDADKLPEDLLDICEIEPMRQEEAGSNRWMPDELTSSAFCRLGELRTVPVTEYDNRFDLWTIDAELSAGCGGPEIVEEIMY